MRRSSSCSRTWRALPSSQDAVAAVGESSVSDLKTRPDYAVTVHKALVGFIELKAPGKGADPRKFKDPHDKEQWEKFRSLPNLMYTDGNAFSLWQDGELVGRGHLRSSATSRPRATSCKHRRGCWVCSRGSSAGNPFRRAAPRTWPQSTARLCRLLRDEVTEQLALGARLSRRSPWTGASCSFPRPRTRGSPTAMLRPSRSAC